MTPAAICLRCLTPVGTQEPVVFEGAEPVHLACYVRSSGAADLVGQFLVRHAKPMCHTCLAASAGISFEDAKKATAALRLSREFRVEIGGRCSTCRQERVTIQADTGKPARKPLARLAGEAPAPRDIRRRGPA
jgi:hypothetical protein